MKKYINLILLAFLYCNLQATRIKLPNGKLVNLPNIITIENDSETTVTIAKMVWGKEWAYINLPKSQTITINDINNEVIALGIVPTNDEKFLLTYPYSKYEDECFSSHHWKVKKIGESKAHFKYKLSDIMKAPYKREDPEYWGLKCLKSYHIIIDEQEEAVSLELK